MATSNLRLEAQIRKFWEIHFFLTAHNFANGPHFVALTQLRATKTWSKICCTHLSYTFSESWVRKDSVGTCPEKFSCWKFSGTERFTKRFTFSPISVTGRIKSIKVVCAQFRCHRPSTLPIWTVILHHLTRSLLMLAVWYWNCRQERNFNTT